MKGPPKSPGPRSTRLFAEPGHPPAHDAHIANIDGAARGNPGPASYGVVLRRPDGQPFDSLSKYVGRATNNVAEYYALIAALDYAAAHGIRKLRVRSDSELLVRQMQGRYKVKSPDLREPYERARKLAASLTFFAIEYVPREENRDADALASAALDRTGAEGGRSRLEARELDAGTQPLKPTTRHLPPAPRRVRARYSGGVLHPAEPLDLPDGSEVEITVHKRGNG